MAPGLLDLGSGESIFKGGYAFEKAMKAVYQKPDYANRLTEVTPMVFDVLMGLKITPVDVNQSDYFKWHKKKETIEELTNQAYKLNHPGISQEEKDRQIENIFKKIQNVIKE